MEKTARWRKHLVVRWFLVVSFKIYHHPPPCMSFNQGAKGKKMPTFIKAFRDYSQEILTLTIRWDLIILNIILWDRYS